MYILRCVPSEVPCVCVKHGTNSATLRQCWPMILITTLPNPSLPNTRNEPVRHHLAICFPLLAVLGMAARVDAVCAIDEEGGKVYEIEVRQHTREASRRTIQEEVDDIWQIMEVA